MSIENRSSEESWEAAAEFDWYASELFKRFCQPGHEYGEMYFGLSGYLSVWISFYEGQPDEFILKRRELEGDKEVRTFSYHGVPEDEGVDYKICEWHTTETDAEIDDVYTGLLPEVESAMALHMHSCIASGDFFVADYDTPQEEQIGMEPGLPDPTALDATAKESTHSSALQRTRQALQRFVVSTHAALHT